MSLNPGEQAPDFTLPTDGGGTVTLSALRGRPVVLYFYPKDDTSGCTAEACAFRDAFPDFSAPGAVVIGVSRDSVSSHDRFKAKHGLPFPWPPTSTGRFARPTGCGRKRACTGANTWASSARPS